MIPLTLSGLEAAYLHDLVGTLDSLEPITQSAKDGLSRELLERIGSAYLELVPDNGNCQASNRVEIIISEREARCLLAMVKSDAFGMDKKTLVGIPVIRQLYAGLHALLVPSFADADGEAAYELTEQGKEHLAKLHNPHSEGGDV